MEKYIKYNITKSDDLGEGTTDELVSAYADYEIDQVANYLKGEYPGFEIEVGHNTNGLNPNCTCSDHDLQNEIIDTVSQYIEDNFQDWLETAANSLIK
ncbi:MAG: hypothetical protein PHS84_14750 [Paludibacter sp.]|nr:hypothetical protein [Paludibacter sp.]